MNRSLALFVSSAGFFLLAAGAGAQDDSTRPIRFPRHPALSPDARRIAFSFQGDIWTVPAAGGQATRVTLHEAHDQLPSWSPDGKWIAFSSNREGNYDVWLMPSGGGKPRQLTFHTGDDLVNGWSPDGKEILFTSVRETTRYPTLYTVAVDGGRVRRAALDEFTLASASFTPDGKSIVATRHGNWQRKAYRGSGNANLMLFPAATPGPGQWLSKEEENERWPLISPDGKGLFYVSDKEGVGNLYRRALSGGKATPLTHFKDGNLFYPTLAANGDLLAFEHDFGIWTVSPKGGEPTALKIYAPSDDRSNTLRRETYTSGVQEAALSPDGKQVALVVHGEIFLQRLSGGTGDSVRLTQTPQREQDVEWSPDGKSLVFCSDQNGSGDLFLLDVATKQTRRLTHTSGDMEHSPRFSPDGKQIAFLRGWNGARLCVVAPEGGEARVLVHDPQIGGVEWSPDSKWLAYHRMKSHTAGTMSDVFVVDVASGQATNVTHYPVVNTNPEWSRDGKRLYFLSDRSGNRNLWRVSLRDEAPSAEDMADGDEPGPKADPAGGVKIDFADIEKRARAVTTSESNVGAYDVAPDGKSVVFAMSQLGRTDLWRVSAQGGALTRLTQSGESGSGLTFFADGTKLLYLSGGGIRTLAPAGGTPSPVAFRARMDVDTRVELLQMFDEAWRKIRDAFYDEKMHGRDWNQIRAAYRPVVEDITYKEDFYVLFNLALGELNASHMGLSGSTGNSPDTASLGVELDDTYAGPGVKVKSVMPKGPADRDETRLRPGDLILKIDGQDVTGVEPYHRLLLDKSAKRVELLVNTEPKEEGARTVRLRAITLAAYKNLEYDRWVKAEEQEVTRLSGGKLGYLHLSAMNDENLEKFRRAVFGDLQEKEGLVLDIRFNPGGGIADELLAVLQDKIWSYRTLRADTRKLPAPLQAWDKPVCVLINQACASNAEAFPWGFKTLKLGKIVGVATHGSCIGTGSTTLIDGSSLRTPTVGAYTLDGINMENHGCPPDILIENTPEDFAAGRDRQLERAVSELIGK